MYLSRIPLNPNNRNTALSLIRPSMLHGAIEDALGRKDNRNLWRIDMLHSCPYLLILSQEKPDLQSVADQFGFKDEPGETRSYDSLLSRIEKGSRWQFRLTANPTYTTHYKQDAKESRGQLAAHKTAYHQTQWLIQQGKNRGFEVSDLQISKKQWYSFKKKNGHQVTFLSVTFEGVLTVQDPEKIREALISGIGREKSYGQGLLTLMRYHG